MRGFHAAGLAFVLVAAFAYAPIGAGWVDYQGLGFMGIFSRGAPSDEGSAPMKATSPDPTSPPAAKPHALEASLSPLLIKVGKNFSRTLQLAATRPATRIELELTYDASLYDYLGFDAVTPATKDDELVTVTERASGVLRIEILGIGRTGPTWALGNLRFHATEAVPTGDTNFHLRAVDVTFGTDPIAALFPF